MFDDVHKVENGTVVGWDVSIGREKEVAPGPTASIGFTEVAGITGLQESCHWHDK